MRIKTGYIACVGRPNVGKSTLINRLVGTKISAVSPKPQTTRRSIVGIKTITDEDRIIQLIFIDTPGIHRPKNEISSEMVKNAIEALKSANLVYHLIDASEGIKGEDIDIAENLKLIKMDENTVLGLGSGTGIDMRIKTHPHIFCLLTKIDLVKKEELLPMMDEVGKWSIYSEIIPISALRGYGIDDLLKTTIRYIPDAEEILYPQEMVFGHPIRILIQEIIMEKIYNNVHMEIPYSTAVEIEEITERENGMLYIKATIYVEKKNQKKILVGKDGQKIKQIGTLAREEIEFLMNKRVYLDLWVKVKENWRKNLQFVKRIYFSE